MRVLPAVFTDTWSVRLDVPRVFVRTIERGSQQEQGLRAAVKKMRADCVHGAFCVLCRHGFGKHGPRLRNRIDPTFRAMHGSQRGSVVVVTAPIPLAIPAQFQHRAQTACLVTITIGSLTIALCVANWRECREYRVQEKSEPSAFTTAGFSDSVETIVPVATADERQSVGPDSQAFFDGTNTVLENRSFLLGDVGLQVGLL